MYFVCESSPVSALKVQTNGSQPQIIYLCLSPSCLKNRLPPAFDFALQSQPQTSGAFANQVMPVILAPSFSLREVTRLGVFEVRSAAMGFFGGSSWKASTYGMIPWDTCPTCGEDCMVCTCWFAPVKDKSKIHSIQVIQGSSLKPQEAPPALGAGWLEAAALPLPSSRPHGLELGSFSSFTS